MSIEESEVEEVKKPAKIIGRKFAFYGTLRKGQGNYNRLVARAEGMVFEGEHVLSGYKMFSFGGFPFVIPSEDTSDTITVELFDIPDEYVVKSIHGMEIGAGYKVKEITVNDNVYWLYVYPNSRDYEWYPRVEGGDWVKYVNKRYEQIEKDRKSETRWL